MVPPTVGAAATLPPSPVCKADGVRIGILGGTGPAGRALGARLASVGFDVVIGSRSKYRAMEVVDGCSRSGPTATSPSMRPTTRARPVPTSS